uniref:SWIM-type domain-containing protein n=1 Tax=Lactuca sativa TaxID=4236 RepID=A0A9R1W9D2_LACSA|nr:hypothetical protein LSAT_V11C300126600 [Lactuca sativa]
MMFTSKHMMDHIESNLTITVKALQENFESSIKLDSLFIRVITKSSMMFRDYILELQSTNTDTTVKLQFESEPNPSASSKRFKRMYLCLGGIKKVFRALLRDFLVRIDSNDGIYPLAYAIVKNENTNGWKWLLECIEDDMDLYANPNFTFISDRQKLFPCVEHRFCLGHIRENMRKTWRNKEYKNHLWKYAIATIITKINHIMKEFSLYDIKTYNWLKQMKLFHIKLIDGRDKPLISCFDYIREYMMKRIYKIIKDQHVVDMVKRVCSCRKWELTGFPCKHVIAFLNDKAR